MGLPRGLMVPRAETVTNARIKQYLNKDVLQVANDYIFPSGDFETAGWDGKSKRDYDVSKPGEAKDPERSLEESKRRAKFLCLSCLYPSVPLLWMIVRIGFMMAPHGVLTGRRMRPQWRRKAPLSPCRPRRVRRN